MGRLGVRIIGLLDWIGKDSIGLLDLFRDWCVGFTMLVGCKLYIFKFNPKIKLRVRSCFYWACLLILSVFLLAEFFKNEIISL